MSALMQAIPEGFKQTEVGIIPEDWNAAPLHEVCSFGGGTTPPRSQHDRYFVGGNNNWIKTTDLNNSLIEISEELITDLAIAETGLKKHPVGSVLVAMYGGFNQIGRTGYITQPSSINQALVAVKPKPKKLHSYYLLSELNYNVDYWKGVASSSRKDPNITSNDVKNYKIALPSLEEQTAIANALSDVDALLIELENLIAKKQAIKTATMQQLLTGKTRLPQFTTYTEGDKQGQPKGTKPSELGEIPADWDVVSLGDLAKFHKGKGLPKSDISEFGKHECVHYGELFTVYGPQIIKLRSKTNHVEGTIKSESNDILMPTSDVTPNGLATASGLKQKGVILGGDILIIRPNKDTLDSIFFSYLVCISKKQIMQLVTGSTVYHLYGSDMATFEFSCPQEIKEQAAIATILSDMDNEIQTLEQRLTKTRQIKQGMMQQLLTGRTRLPFNKET
ncbi:restriction endonuclease subunit S [Shewanella colwelliana]|uniref:restriction endonuclease subunit S n=1 Tax=Shewanella colwelliana TaxID=23 RepID=UPI003CFF3705